MDKLEQEDTEVKPTAFDGEDGDGLGDDILPSAFNFQSPTISRRKKIDNSFLNVSVLVCNDDD